MNYTPHVAMHAISRGVATHAASQRRQPEAHTELATLAFPHPHHHRGGAPPPAAAADDASARLRARQRSRKIMLVLMLVGIGMSAPSGFALFVRQESVCSTSQNGGHCDGAATTRGSLLYYLLFLVGVCIFVGTFAAGILLASISENSPVCVACQGPGCRRLRRLLGLPEAAVVTPAPRDALIEHTREAVSRALEANAPLPRVPTLQGVLIEQPSDGKATSYAVGIREPPHGHHSPRKRSRAGDSSLDASSALADSPPAAAVLMQPLPLPRSAAEIGRMHSAHILEPGAAHIARRRSSDPPAARGRRYEPARGARRAARSTSPAPTSALVLSRSLPLGAVRSAPIEAARTPRVVRAASPPPPPFSRSPSHSAFQTPPESPCSRAPLASSPARSHLSPRSPRSRGGRRRPSSTDDGGSDGALSPRLSIHLPQVLSPMAPRAHSRSASADPALALTGATPVADPPAAAGRHAAGAARREHPHAPGSGRASIANPLASGGGSAALGASADGHCGGSSGPNPLASAPHSAAADAYHGPPLDEVVVVGHHLAASAFAEATGAAADDAPGRGWTAATLALSASHSSVPNPATSGSRALAGSAWPSSASLAGGPGPALDSASGSGPNPLGSTAAWPSTASYVWAQNAGTSPCGPH